MKSLVTRGLATAALLTLGAVANAQVVFDFQFDNTPNGTVTPPIVGTGTLTLASDPGDGIFAFNTINPTVAFSFVNGSSFNNGDIQTPTGNVQVQISTNAGVRTLAFGGIGGGPFSGSFDLVRGGTNLSFQPNFGNLYFNNNLANFGTFSAILAVNPVPEPGSVALMGGMVTLGGLALRRRARR